MPLRWRTPTHTIHPAVDAQQLRAMMGQFGGGAPAQPGQDIPTNDNAETVHISSLALLKVRPGLLRATRPPPSTC